VDLLGRANCLMSSLSHTSLKSDSAEKPPSTLTKILASGHFLQTEEGGISGREPQFLASILLENNLVRANIFICQL